jgi:hypothetical protein
VQQKSGKRRMGAVDGTISDVNSTIPVLFYCSEKDVSDTF